MYTQFFNTDIEKLCDSTYEKKFPDILTYTLQCYLYAIYIFTSNRLYLFRIIKYIAYVYLNFLNICFDNINFINTLEFLFKRE